MLRHMWILALLLEIENRLIRKEAGVYMEHCTNRLHHREEWSGMCAWARLNRVVRDHIIIGSTDRARRNTNTG